MKFEKFLVLGLGKSGLSAINFLLKHNAEVCIFDDDTNKMIDILSNYKNVKSLDYQTEFQIKQFKYIVVSPGIKPNHNILSLAKLSEVPIITEIELYNMCNKTFLLGITGSNGKTTTATLLNNILNKKYNVKLCGNIGEPVCEIRSQQYNTLVVETSSFQLEYLNKLRYNIAVVTNIHENHLDWHFNMKDYIKAKSNIFKNSKRKDILILNADDKYTNKINLNNVKCKILWFSSKKEVNGIFVKNDKIILNLNNKQTEICDMSAIKIIGEHNIQNALISVLVAKLLKVSNKIITESLLEFTGVEHRLEHFYTFNNIECYNDSKSTTINSTLCAIKALKNKQIVLLLGGSNKNLNYNLLAKNINSNIKNILVFGKVKEEISNSLNSYNIKHEVCENINDAITKSVRYSLELSNTNDTKSQSGGLKNKVVILFSPASASFDSFNSFEERGIYFKEYLKSCVEDII